MQTGKVKPEPLRAGVPDGKAVIRRQAGAAKLEVVRASLYGDIKIALSARDDEVLADWRRDRDRLLAGVSVGALIFIAFATALSMTLRQSERAEAERARASRALADAIEAMSDGFVMWDEEDRLVACNQRYRELYQISAPFLVPGARFEDIIRQGAQRGQYPQAGDEIEAFVARTVAWHREGQGSIERLLPDGRWLLITERRMADGRRVGIRTDITALKAAQAELAEANARATEAAAEARQQNAALIERESRIRFLAHHDDLTGLQNRVLFREQIAAALQRGADGTTGIALLFIDLDRFKDVNDTLGHPVGDMLLRLVAGRLVACVGDAGRIARLSGDEFAVICPSGDHPHDAETLSLAIIEEISKPYSIQGHTLNLSASVGIAVYDGTTPDADVLLKQADLALYRAKAQGRGVSCVFSAEMAEHLRERLETEADLRGALAEDQFELVYQPIYEMATRRLCGFEALLRWRHPRRGLINPADFIPVAEETRLIVEIGEWVLGQACRDIMLLPPRLRISINLSPVQLAVGDIVSSVREALRDSGLEPGRLELEITETALFANLQRSTEALRRLRELGVRLVLDDFGTGYSSLSHLRLYPLNKIKIDRSFVRDMTMRPESAAIVGSVAALAGRLRHDDDGRGHRDRRTMGSGAAGRLHRGAGLPAGQAALDLACRCHRCGHRSARRGGDPARLSRAPA